MSTSMTVAEKAILEPRGQRLAEISMLFEAGALSDATSDDSFILRLNTLVVRRRKAAEKNVPGDIPDAISTAGKLNWRAELVAFGRWLLVDGRPGMKKQGGRQPDPRTILNCVALSMFELHIRPDQKARKLFDGDRDSRKQDITKRDLSERWHVLFDDRKEASFFDARLRSMKRILPAYLEHLKSGACVVDGKQIRKSPEIRKVSKAIAGRSAVRSKVTTSALSNPVAPVPAIPIPATPSPFEVELRYSSPSQMEEYRNLPGGSVSASRLRYQPEPVKSTSASGEVRKNRKDKIALMPDIAIRDSFRTQALIDRVVLLVNTVTFAEYATLQKTIRTNAKTSPYVFDLTLKNTETAWGSPLPTPDLNKKTGFHFAILIQEPTPELLRVILNVIRDAHGIDGNVLLHLVEVSVDFYPRKCDTLGDAIMLREQMVGLLQRHHWTRHGLLLGSVSRNSRHADARQIYKNPDRRSKTPTKTRYLFARSKKGSLHADCDLYNPEIRQRILTTHAGEDLYLDSTMWKGARTDNFQVSIQQKIADRRNPEKNTMEILPDHLRRARIEVTISGNDTLDKGALGTVNELASASFRKLAKPYLSFSLAEIEPQQHIWEDAQTQMRTRGVYGIELRHRARAVEHREELRRERQKLPRKTDREGLGLKNWEEMNDVVGRALDELRRRWNGFSWS